MRKQQPIQLMPIHLQPRNLVEREEFWKQVYLASIYSKSVAYKDQPKAWADEALKEFDARFNPASESVVGVVDSKNGVVYGVAEPSELDTTRQ